MKRADEFAVALAAQDPEQRRRAVESLPALIGEPEALARFVLRGLADEDWRVRKQAVEVAVALAPSADVLQGLVAALAPGENVGLRNAVVEALGAYGSAAVDALARALPEFDADGRKLAAEALARTNLSNALAVLGPLLSDRDPNVRAAALEAIAVVGGGSAATEAHHILLAFLEKPDEEAFVRLCALDGVNRLGTPLPWSTIERMLEDPALERSALTAAGRSARPEALGALLRSLERATGGGVAATASALVEYVRSFTQNQWLLRSETPSAAVVSRLLQLAAPGNEELSLRKDALVVAGALGIELIAPIAAAALSDSRLLAEADESLSLLGPRAVPALLERAALAEPDTRAACIEIVSGLADATTAPLAVAEIRQWLASGSPAVVRASLGALSRLGDESCLSSVHPWLAQRETVSAAETALASLAQRYPDSARDFARTARSEGPEAHATAVIHSALPPPIRDSVADDVAYLSLLLSDPRKSVRRAALAGLGCTGSELATEAAAFALTDEEADVRHEAVLTLCRLRAPDGTVSGLARLLELVEKSDDQELVAAALGGLGEVSDTRVLAALRPLVRSAPPMVAVAAVEALARVSDPRRIEALIEGLSHREAEVVKASMLALGDASDPRVRAHYGACLDHEAWDVRRLSADMLGRAGGEAAVALLRARLTTEDNPRVVEAITRALELGSGIRHTPLPPRAGSLRPR